MVFRLSRWIDPIINCALSKKKGIVSILIKIKRSSNMKYIYKFAIAFSILAVLSGCTGTVYNKEKTCGEDYLIVPALSIPAMIGACETHEAK